MKQYKNLFLSALLIFSVGISVFAAAPAGYYRSLNGLKGQALKNAVHNLIKNHTVVSYNSLWNYFPSTDCHPTDKSVVWDMYSNNVYHFNGFKGVSGMHKEHSFPKSWWGGAELKLTPTPTFTTSIQATVKPIWLRATTLWARWQMPRSTMA